MPLYEYSCKNCDHMFEVLVTNGADVDCPQCHSSRNLERLFSLPAKPRSTGQTMPMSCDPNLPPCGPGCCRLGNSE